MNNSEETPIDIWIFGDELDKRACSKRVAFYLINKTKAIVFQAEIESKVGFASEDDMHKIFAYVLDGVREYFTICHGDDDNGNVYDFLDFDPLPEDFDIFVTNYKEP